MPGSPASCKASARRSAARQELRRAGTRLVGTVAYFAETCGEGLLGLALDILNRRLAPTALFTRHQLLTAQNVNHVYPNDMMTDFPGPAPS